MSPCLSNVFRDCDKTIQADPQIDTNKDFAYATQSILLIELLSCNVWSVSKLSNESISDAQNQYRRGAGILGLILDAIFYSLVVQPMKELIRKMVLDPNVSALFKFRIDGFL